MRIAIVEDDPVAQARLIQFLKKYCTEHKLTLSLQKFDDGIKIVNNYQENFDLIYFDVKMPLMNGMTAAQRIREKDEKVLIVFLTNYIQWAIKGYSVNAVDFLLKPINYFNFSQHFDKIVKHLKKQRATILIKSNKELQRIFIDEIFYIESQGHYLYFHTLKNTFESITTLKETEAKLKSYGFSRCNNCYLINLAHVDKVTKNFVLIANNSLKISRPRKRLFLNDLTAYLGNEEI